MAIIILLCGLLLQVSGKPTLVTESSTSNPSSSIQTTSAFSVSTEAPTTLADAVESTTEHSIETQNPIEQSESVVYDSGSRFLHQDPYSPELNFREDVPKTWSIRGPLFLPIPREDKINPPYIREPSISYYIPDETVFPPPESKTESPTSLSDETVPYEANSQSESISENNRQEESSDDSEMPAEGSENVEESADVGESNAENLPESSEPEMPSVEDGEKMEPEAKEMGSDDDETDFRSPSTQDGEQAPEQDGGRTFEENPERRIDEDFVNTEVGEGNVQDSPDESDEMTSFDVKPFQPQDSYQQYYQPKWFEDSKTQIDMEEGYPRDNLVESEMDVMQGNFEGF